MIWQGSPVPLSSRFCKLLLHFCQFGNDLGISADYHILLDNIFEPYLVAVVMVAFHESSVAICPRYGSCDLDFDFPEGSLGLGDIRVWVWFRAIWAWFECSEGSKKDAGFADLLGLILIYS